MIFGASHVTLLLQDPASPGEIERGGYEHVFTAEVPCSLDKNLLLRVPAASHGLAYFKHNRFIGVEFVTYVEGGREQGGFELALPLQKGFNLPGIHSVISQGPPLLSYRCSNLRAECDFWRSAVRLSPIIEGGTALAEFRSPVPTWTMALELREDPAAHKWCLDDAGCACLSVLTTNLVEDSERCASAGAEDMTQIQELELNGRQMRVRLFRTPAGAPLELLQILE